MKSSPLLRSFLVLVVLLCIATVQGQVAFNRTGTKPNPKAMLDINDVSKGLLIPRMTAAQRITASTVQGLLVYQTDSLAAGPAGFYYFEGSWRHVAFGKDVWQVGGNSGTVPGTDFIGTSNTQHLVMRTNGAERARLAGSAAAGGSGQFQIYVTAPAPPPTEKVEVQGGVRFTGTNAAANPGTIRYVASGTPSVTNPASFEGYVSNGASPNPTGWFPLENNISSRKEQDYPNPSAGCDPPTNVTNALIAPGDFPAPLLDRPWPIIGTRQFQTGSTTETPYSGLWEDGRKQYLYKWEDLAATGICPGAGNPITAVAFDVGAAGTGLNHFCNVSMKGTGVTTLSSIDGSGGFTLCGRTGIPITLPAADNGHSSGFQVIANQWNVHDFNVSGFTWNGIGYNVILEYAQDNQNWSGNFTSSVWCYTTTYNSMVGVFCDACGHSTPGGAACGWGPPTGCPAQPLAVNQAASPLCGGWGWQGGWTMTFSSSLRECSGDPANWVGGSGVSQRLPRVAFRANYTGGGLSVLQSEYNYAQRPIMIGSEAWATSGAYPNLKFKGPGTLSAEKSIWGGALLLSDHVFDMYYDGSAKLEDGPKLFGYKHLPVKEMANYVQTERHLPTIDGRQKWNEQGSFSVDHLSNQLWVTVEQQSLYINELNQRMDALQQFLVEKRLNELKAQPAPTTKK